MNKVLFLQEKDKNKLLNELSQILETKNRLLRLIITNPDKKTSARISRENQTRYEEQIILLEKIRGMILSCDSREKLQKINRIIDHYNSLE
jgi:hypothetical protein